MKTKNLNTEKNDKPMFAFLPEMVLDHLNEATPNEPTAEISNEPVIQKITISAEPEIPNLEDSLIEILPKKENTKPIKTVYEPISEKPNSKTEDNFIIQFLNKIKIYLSNFLNQSKWKQTC
ncbi:hypothetical protein [Flavobacterium taihuense]|uniref:Uncharacterized protein n=1 Tax=Flavobacterium taihuense TaxID=2857508 RepID=A0ABS6XQY0_9FLAO|nr:hypothetical protein [Flavobacterium taihuense]MBW4359081.1 hypothetical protein [Flavobacterium taihuense]